MPEIVQEKKSHKNYLSIKVVPAYLKVLYRKIIIGVNYYFIFLTPA